jgi:hypothetical protein
VTPGNHLVVLDLDSVLIGTGPFRAVGGIRTSESKPQCLCISDPKPNFENLIFVLT